MQYSARKRPEVPTQFAISLARKHYGLEVFKVKELVGYDDKNFYLNTSDGEFVLKVTNSDESSNVSVLEAQNEIMLLLKRHGVNCNVPQVSLMNEFINLEEIVQERPNAIRLFDFIKGQPLEKLPFTYEMMYSLGQFSGKLDSILKDFKHPSLNDNTVLLNWDLQRIHSIEHYIQAKYLGSKDREDLMSGIYKKYTNVVLPALKTLNKQVIHNDINACNIFVHNDMQSFTIIDFGDITYSYRVFEIAIIMANVLLYQYIRGVDNYCEYPGIILKGYQSVNPLSDLELTLIYWCVAARFLQLLVIGSVKLSLEPDNEYVMENEFHLWDLLPGYLAIGDSQLLEKWLQKNDF